MAGGTPAVGEREDELPDHAADWSQSALTGGDLLQAGRISC